MRAKRFAGRCGQSTRERSRRPNERRVALLLAITPVELDPTLPLPHRIARHHHLLAPPTAREVTPIGTAKENSPGAAAMITERSATPESVSGQNTAAAPRHRKFCASRS